MDATIEDVVVEHMMPGRVRLRFRSKRDDVAFFEELIAAISQFAAVDAIDANPRTGSVLIRHSATPDELLLFASVSGMIDPEKLAPSDEDQAGNANGRGVAASGGPSIGTLALTALAILQALRGRVLGSATEQFWHASRLMGMDHPAAGLALIGMGFIQLLSGRVLAPASSLFTYALINEAMKVPSPKQAAGLDTPDLQRLPATSNRSE